MTGGSSLIERSRGRWTALLLALLLNGALVGPAHPAATSEKRPVVRLSDAARLEQTPQALHPDIASARAAAGMDGADRDRACEPQWQPGLFATANLFNDLGETVWGMAVVDDGSGPVLLVGGDFTSAGGQEVSGIVQYNGSAWTTMGSVLGDEFGPPFARCFAVFDDGAGPAIYVGGDFDTAGGQSVNNIARWDGSDWAPLGSGLSWGFSSGTVRALVVFDDGSGPALYAGGFFNTSGGQPTGCVARWDGTSWSSLGEGFDGNINALAVFDDGTGPALYAGGIFFEHPGQQTRGVFRWDGSDWSLVGVLPANDGFMNVWALYEHDDGSGPALYAGGYFTTMDGQTVNSIARWNGEVWSPVGSGFIPSPGGQVRVFTLTSFDDGSGSALYAGGQFIRSVDGQPVRGVLRWDGSAWSQAGSSFDPNETFSDIRINALAVFQPEGASQATLYAGGTWSVDPNGSQARDLMLLDGSVWRPVSGGTGSTGSGSVGTVRAMTVFDDGTGPALYAGGTFNLAGGRSASRIARWSGTGWSPLGTGLNASLTSMAVFDDGSGPALYAGGVFTTAGGQPANRMARWDGTSWTPLGEGMDGIVYALAVFDDGTGPALYAGGQFTTAGGQPANRIARWDGSTWSPLGTGLELAGISASVRALTVFDNGTGPALYAAGGFDTAGGQPAANIARWDGSTWSPLGSGLAAAGLVLAMTVFDDGSGPTLYAGSQFSSLSRWDGSGWSTMGLNGSVQSLAVFDDGSGSALYAGGIFPGGTFQPGLHMVMRWNNTEWLPLATSNESGGATGSVLSLAVFDDGGPSGPALIAGGSFTSLTTSRGVIRSECMARWQGCPIVSTCTPDLNDDGLLNFFDIARFVNLYQTQNPTADWNSDGLINFFDFAAYINAFNAGCP